jgi:hypothetical protein
MDELGQVLKAYYNEIGVIPDGSRRLNQVFARSAMMVAMRKYMSLHQVGKVFGKNHATIHHAGRKHEENMDWSEGYRYYYEVAQRILVDKPSLKIQADNTLMAQFSRQRLRIMELEGQVNNLKNRILELEGKSVILEADGNRN